MKTSQLEVGQCYKIRYRTNMKKKRSYGYYTPPAYAEPLQDGLGILKKTGATYHTFELLDDGKIVYATAQGVLKHTPMAAKQAPTKSAQDILDEKILTATKESLKEEVGITKTFLSGLKVNSEIKEVDGLVVLVVDSGNAMKLNSVLETVYSKLIESGEFV